MKLKEYYYLAKPGIIYGNLLSATAGFLLASEGVVDLALFLRILTGFSLAIGSACIFNNIIDRRIDRLMSRTKNRAIPAGKISVLSAMVYGLVLLFGASLILAGSMNKLSIGLGIVSYLMYVFLYAFAKRKSSLGTIVGAVPGSSPPVVAYVVVSGGFDITALILFLILFTWQISHFYSIAIYRHADYKAAGIPLLSIRRGFSYTARRIITFVIFYTFSLCLLAVYSKMTLIYLLSVLPFAFFWLLYGLLNYQQIDIKIWARKMFFISLLCLTAFSVSVSANSFLI